MIPAKITVEEINDPKEIARFQARIEQASRNDIWLQLHWADLLPRARGKLLAVAGQEAFVADTHREAWALAKAAHPDDEGAFVQYVIPERGPRIYGYQLRMVAV
jgi:hypothetical protein